MIGRHRIHQLWLLLCLVSIGLAILLRETGDPRRQWTAHLNKPSAPTWTGPKSAHDYYVSAVDCETNGDLEQALADYDQSIRLDPKYSAAKLMRGLAQFAKDKESKSKEDSAENDNNESR
jgi:hypothetical protein